MILVIGANGFLGRRVVRHFRASGRQVVTASHAPDADFPIDLNQVNWHPHRFRSIAARDAVICAAITNIDQCRREASTAFRFNVTHTIQLIMELQAAEIRVIYCSSDLVFTGDRGDYHESEMSAPTTEYGRHKAAVEAFLQTQSNAHAVLRMSKLYSMEPDEGSFIHQSLSILRSGGTIRAADDQVVMPTSVEDVVLTIEAIVTQKLDGCFHVTPVTRLTRYDVARSIAERIGLQDRIKACSVCDIPVLEPRPKNLWLNGHDTVAKTKIRPAEFDDVIDLVISQSMRQMENVQGHVT